MSELPPNIDAILSSIRSRMTEEGQAPAPEAPPAPVAAAVPVTDNIGELAIGEPMTLEGLMRAMLEPMLKQWLDANMPEIVERIAQAEIRRLTGKD
ncbi:DUF2497 domain-containing protein [Sandarakinorhabdus sp. DWP1-3-1]|uniref:DUF2497 domain-containing protein n=1 Tax=Sandarakinorhabdus sp. DWP1-3-1 TaxID=2804627 RepID=UPI003CF070E8